MLEEYGEADEQERPGTSGGKAGRESTPGPAEEKIENSVDGSVPRSERANPDRLGQDRQRSERPTQSRPAAGDLAGDRVSGKRPAEEEADDSGRGERSDWRNFTEPSSSSQAPRAMQSGQEPSSASPVQDSVTAMSFLTRSSWIRV